MIFKTDGWMATFLLKYSQTYKGKSYRAVYDPDKHDGEGGHNYEPYWDLPNNFCQATRAVVGTFMFWLLTGVTGMLLFSVLLGGLVEWFRLFTGGVLVASADTPIGILLKVGMILDLLAFVGVTGWALVQGSKYGYEEFRLSRERRQEGTDYVPRVPSQGWLNFKEGVSGVHRKFCPLVKWEE